MKYAIVFILLFLLPNYAMAQNKTSVDSTNTNITEVDSTLKNNITVVKRFLKDHELWDELLQKHVSNDGKVNYKSFKTTSNSS